ncbi:20999_t:CDS:2, partial [Gigaspora rosea]
NTTTTTTIESIALQTLSNYIAELISNAENNNGISVEIHLDLNDNIFSIVIFDDPKTIVRIIIDKIEKGDGYAWTSTTSPNVLTRFDNVVTYYFACSQCHELKQEYKESNRKRITRFDYNTVPDEVKQAIQANLHLDPVQIRAILRNRFDILNITAKQIHYWWLVFTQNLYKIDKDHVISALNFLRTNNAGCKLCFELITDKLCQWHIEHAMMEKLRSHKRLQYTKYQFEEATTEFNFINPNFKPDLTLTEPEYYISDYMLLTPDFSSQAQSSTAFSANGDSEMVDSEIYQQYESKVAELEHLTSHLREEPSNNNIRHIKNVIENMSRTCTIINDIKSLQYNSKRSKTWKAKPWSMFL